MGGLRAARSLGFLPTPAAGRPAAFRADGTSPGKPGGGFRRIGGMSCKELCRLGYLVRILFGLKVASSE